MPDQQQHPPPPAEDQPRPPGMPFLDHLEELRRRLIYSVLSIAVLAGVSFAFRNELFQLITLPLGEIKLHFTDVTGSFYAYLKVSLIAGIVAASPFILYQLWAFISPGLYRREKAAVLPLVFVSTVLFLVGGFFCYQIVLPLALGFLISFSDGLLIPIITVDSYISFAGLLLIAFGIGFELPVLAYLLGKMGLIQARTLAKGRRYAFVVILIAGAVITPPDVFTQVLLAGPVYLLYEISIIVVRLTAKRPED